MNGAAGVRESSQVANIAAALQARTAERPSGVAVILPGKRNGEQRSWTFRELDERSDALGAGLESIGIGRGTRTALMVRPSLELFALTFALFKRGIVPVIVDPGMGVRPLGRCFLESRPEAFLGIPRANVARALLGWGRGTIRTVVTTGRTRLFASHTLREVARRGESAPRQPIAPTRHDDPAAILFTSGSTGSPKGAVYTHANFCAQVEALRDTYGIEPGEIDLCTFPLFALFAPALGMTAVIPDMDPTRPGRANPEKILGAITRFGVTNLFGSPALIGRVGKHGAEKGTSLPTLRRIISAGAPVPARVVRTFARLLPSGVQVFTPYGSTEALPVTSIGSDEILSETSTATDRGKGVCVGRPVHGITLEVIRTTEDPIATWNDALRVPRGQIGEIAVRGPTVTREYFGRPSANQLHKIDAGDGTGAFYHRMGDLGYADDRGRIWFCGRKSQRVETESGVLHTIPCEAIFNTHPRVARTALVGVARSGRVEPVLCVELSGRCRAGERESLRQEIQAVGAAHEMTRAIRTVLFHPCFPVDVRHNAKIGREALRAWAQGRLGT